MIERLDEIDLTAVQWLLPLAVTLHNLEEAIWLPAWARGPGRWRRPVGAEEFRIAVAAVTAQMYLVTWASSRTGRQSLGAYLMAGSAVMMLLNAFLPHAVATVLERRYAPGVGTGLLLNVPVTTYLLCRMVREDYVSRGRLGLAAAGVSLATLALLPLLLAAGRRLTGTLAAERGVLCEAWCGDQR